MRMRLTFSTDAPMELPVNYSDQLTGFMYANIQDEMYRRHLHDAGFPYHEKRVYKHFTYSRLIANSRFNPGKKTIRFAPPFQLIVSSPLDRFLQELAYSMLSNQNLFIGNYRIRLEKFEVLATPSISDAAQIKMLSPLVVYSTLTHPNGLKHTYYYRPNHEKFSEMVEANIKRKYVSLYPEQSDILNSPFRITPIRVLPQDKVVTKYKGIIIEGWMGDFELRGDSKLIELAYHSGLGSKGQQGFGLFEIQRREGGEWIDSRDSTNRERTAK